MSNQVKHLPREYRKAINRSLNVIRENSEKLIEHFEENIRTEDMTDQELLVELYRRSPELCTLAAIEKQHIMRCIELCDGNRSEAAKVLDIGERTIYRKLQEWGSE